MHQKDSWLLIDTKSLGWRSVSSTAEWWENKEIQADGLLFLWHSGSLNTGFLVDMPILPLGVSPTLIKTITKDVDWWCHDVGLDHRSCRLPFLNNHRKRWNSVWRDSGTNIYVFFTFADVFCVLPVVIATSNQLASASRKRTVTFDKLWWIWVWT